MDTLEIILLAAGAIILILGFLIPQPKAEVTEKTKTLAKEEIHNMVTREMDGIKGHVDDVVEEAVGYAVEKTERSLERLTNEKIMAVNEYSDTVLKEIHKNHEEVMFLYDMLNSKHASLKNTVSEVNKTVKEAAETTREVEEVVNSFQKLTPENLISAENVVSVENRGMLPGENLNVENTQVNFNGMKVNDMNSNSMNLNGSNMNSMNSDDGNMSQKDAVNSELGQSSASEQNANNMLNSNDRILELYRMGKNEVTIAKELGIGVGEVQLVVGLFKKA